MASAIKSWKKVVNLISYLLSAKRTLKMFSPSYRSGSRRSRSRSRSRVPARRRYSRSRSQSGSEGESYGGSSQTDRRDYSRRKDHSRKRRRSRSEDLDSTPHRHTSNALVPVGFTRHAEEESSDTSEGDDEGPEDDKREGLDRFRSRSKKIRKVDVSNPLSTFRKQVRQRKQYLLPSKFVKEEWMGLRGMDADGRFI